MANQKLQGFKNSLTAFEKGAIAALESTRRDQTWDTNPYEPGFDEYEAFNNGWNAVRDNAIDQLRPTLRDRYYEALGVSSREEGLIEKYRVDRLDGKQIKDGCIVLEWSDPNARVGIAAFAKAVRQDGYGKLADDLEGKLATY